jgi:hypothetical protein
MPDGKPIRTAADVADWWESQRRETKEILDDFVRDHPDWFGIIVATATETAMDLGAGLVDVLRLGQGTAEGGWGYGRDALRLLAFAGPLGRAGGLLRNAGNARVARLIADPGGPRCAWVAATKALRQVGQRYGGKLFVAVDDLARAAGTSLQHTAGITLESMAAQLRTLGARVGPVQPVANMGEVARLVPRDGSVVMISLNGMRNGARVAGHSIYAFRDALGRVRLMDRSGVYGSLEELGRRYTQCDQFVPRAAAVVENVFGKFVDATEKVAVLAMAALAAPAIGQPTADRALRAYRQGRAGAPSTARFHRVQPGENLSRLAKQYYGDADKWPIIYAGNRKHIGDDPAKLRPTQTLWIPQPDKAGAH